MPNSKHEIKITHFKLVDLREDHDLTQDAIAKKLNITRSRYSMWESGERDLSIENANKIVILFNISFDYLYGLSKTKNKKLRKEINSSLLAKRLKKLRKERQLSQESLGKEVGFSQKACSYYETGKIIPTCKTIIIFAKYFNVSMDYLVGKTDNQNII